MITHAPESKVIAASRLFRARLWQPASDRAKRMPPRLSGGFDLLTCRIRGNYGTPRDAARTAGGIRTVSLTDTKSPINPS